MTDLSVGRAADAAETPRVFRITYTDVDQAQSFFEDMYYPVLIDVPEGRSDFKVVSEVICLGPLTIGRLKFSTPVEALSSGMDGYHVTLPLTGTVRTRQSGHEVTARPEQAAIFRPGPQVQSWQLADTPQLDIKIDQAALDDELSQLLGRRITGPIDLPPAMPTAVAGGRSWRQLIQLIQDEAEHHQGLLYQPLIAEQVRRSVLGGLLLSTPHRYREELDNPVRTGPPRAIRRVLDAMHDQPEWPFTVAELAEIANMSVRSLQEGFRRYLGVAPMAHLQAIRLGRAHEALCVEDPHRITVAAVAHRWGFAHLGRFAQAYKDRYGVCPSDTLRGAA
jgi:AraC-like DNA-binding protein